MSRKNRPTPECRPSQEQLHGLAHELAGALHRRLPCGVRFLIVLADTHEPPGALAYASNMTRESAAGVMLELVESFALELHATSPKPPGSSS